MTLSKPFCGSSLTYLGFEVEKIMKWSRFMKLIYLFYEIDRTFYEIEGKKQITAM